MRISGLTVTILALVFTSNLQRIQGCGVVPRNWNPLQAIFFEKGGCPKVHVVQDFNVTAFLGDWYTQYTSPYWFQSEDHTCQRARYNDNGDGTVGVFNTGGNPNGDYEEVCFFAAPAKGYDGQGAFAVQGGGPNIPVWANYKVLSTDYTSYATVFTCLDLIFFRSQGPDSTARATSLASFWAKTQGEYLGAK